MRKQNWFKKHEKAAAAGFCAAVVGITGLTGYHLQEVHARTYAWVESTENNSTSQKRSEKEKHIREIKDRIEYLEKYDISYDEDTDAVYYDNRKIRWLIDENDDGMTNCLYDENGRIDVYTQRDSSGRLIGVRVASEEEYRNQSDEYRDLENSWPAQEANSVYSFEIAKGNDASSMEEEDAVEITVTEENQVSSDYDDLNITFCEEAGAEEIGEYDKDYSSVTYDAATQKATAVEGTAYYTQDNELYESLGLVWSRKDSCWIYDGEKVKVVYMEDGSFSTWGEVDEEDSVCLYITKKNEAGTVSFRIKDMDYDEMCEMYSRSHSGEKMP